MHYSTELMRGMRNAYLTRPYPDFSLDEVVRRRRAGQTKLVRGENAWVAKGTADTEKGWVQRQVQGTLNKLTEKNKNTMEEKLSIPELFEKEDVTSMVVDMIFRKALDEPENAKLYASVCKTLAYYEADLTKGKGKKGPMQSHLRDAIVGRVQREFRTGKEELMNVEGMCEEEAEAMRLNVMRRKRSNMTFIGELYLSEALSDGNIFALISATMRLEENSKFPSITNVELLIALLNTIGEKIDKNLKSRLDPFFATLAATIKKPDCPYPHRIRFKIMDIVDLRKREWGAKAKSIKAPAAAPSSNHGRDRKAAPAPPASKRGAADVAPSPTASSSSKSWRDSFAAAAPVRNHVSISPGKGLNGRGTASSPAPAPVPSKAADGAFRGPIEPAAPEAPEVPLVKFELRVASMLQEWVAERSNDMILHWVEQFNTCDRFFESESELCVAVAVEVIRSACVTTRKDAQREAFSFLIVGLFLVDTEVFDGFAGALAAAIEDGILEDVPRFSERFMSMLRLTSNEQDTHADVYFDAANVLRLTYNLLEETDDDTVDTLMGFWDRVPHPTLSGENLIHMDIDVLYNVCNPEDAQPGLERLLSHIIHSMAEMDLMEPLILDEFLTLPAEDELCAKVVADYKSRFVQ